MGSYILQRDLYFDRAIELRSSGLSYYRISKIIPVAKQTLRHWCVNFAPSNQSALQYSMKNTVQVDDHASEKDRVHPQDVLALQEELKRVRAELLEAQIKSEAYDELINVAEAKFGIQIRKKAGAKQ